MNDHEVLQHLLNLEAQAAAMIDDAQAEADRKIAGQEKQNRIHYDEVYAREVEKLEASYIRDISAVRANYQKELEAYRENLKNMPLNAGAFSSLAEKFLAGKES